MRRSDSDTRGVLRDISIHAPREGCDAGRSQRHPIGEISIHAPREGCDFGFPGILSFNVMISIHAPREGCDGNMVKYCYRWQSFQSTHPARGATHSTRPTHPCAAGFQSTHPVRGATYCFVEITRYREISIHAPREGCDRRAQPAPSDGEDFNPRTP